MKIGHYSPSIFAQGGIGRYIQRLGAAQEAGGDTVFYLSKNSAEAKQCTIVESDQELYRVAVENELDILHLHKEVDEIPPDGLNIVRTMHGNQASCPSGSRYLTRKNAQCDRKFSRLGCLSGHLIDKCGSSKPERIKSHFARIAKEKKVLPHILTLTVSDFLRKNMLREGYPSDKVKCLLSPAPVATTPTCVPDGIPRFVFLGRLVPQKGVDWLIKSLVHVTNDCLVDIAGEGFLATDAKQLAKRLGVEDKVRFLGWINADETAATIRASRAVVFPSVWHEPAGLVTLEAAAFARPVITAAVGGIPEYAHESFSAIVKPHDEFGLAAAIDRFCDDKDLADSMGKAGYQYVLEKHSFDDFVHDLSKIYKDIAAN